MSRPKLREIVAGYLLNVLDAVAEAYAVIENARAIRPAPHGAGLSRQRITKRPFRGRKMRSFSIRLIKGFLVQSASSVPMVDALLGDEQR